MGWVTGPYARTPHSQEKVAAGSGRPPEGPAAGGGIVPNPGHLSRGQEAPPSRRPCQPPTARKASSQERALWGE